MLSLKEIVKTGVLPISIKDKKRDWEAVERKLRAGYSLEEAARNAGVPLSECLDYVKRKEEEQKTLDYELKRAGQEALKIALTKLTELANGDAREGKHFESTDLLAARELARTALATIKIAKGSPIKDASSDQKDLFDNAADPWVLKEIE